MMMRCYHPLIDLGGTTSTLMVDRLGYKSHVVCGTLPFVNVAILDRVQAYASD